MGLDMYLIKKRYIGKAKIEILENEYDWYKNKGKKITSVSMVEQELGYWRKANQIHKWFVDNVQEGVDDCNEYYVPKIRLEELLQICKDIKRHCKLKKGKIRNGATLKDGEWIPNIEDGKVMTNPEYAQRVLPTQDGFFFGGTDYDQYYMQDINNTIKILKTAIKEYKQGEIYYRSSW